MPSPSAVIRSFVQRGLLGTLFPDNPNVDTALRLASYGEMFNQPLVRKSHNLADEGSYFVANNAQTAIAYTTTVGFSATAPFLIIFNGNVVGGRNVYVDYVNMVANTAGSLTATLSYTGLTVVLDTGNRFSSGATATMTGKSPNMNLGNVTTGATVYGGPLTATAATGGARTIVGQRVARPAVSTTVPNVIGDMYQFNFGGVEGVVPTSLTAANLSICPQALPPLVIGPQQSALIYVYAVGGSALTAPTFFPEVGYWER